MQKIPVSCGKDCGGGCPLLACVENNTLVKVCNNPAGGKYLKGCINGFNMPEMVYAKDRLKMPLIRTGKRGSGQYREASWEEALDLVADKLSEIRQKYGVESIMHLGGTGSVACALHNGETLSLRFLNQLGGCTAYTNSYSTGASKFAVPYMFGTPDVGYDPATLQYSKMIVLWGANLIETRQGTAMPWRVLEAKKRGIPIVVIDPRVSATVKRLASWYIQCKPGTDIVLMMAVLNVLVRKQLIDENYINRYSSGFEQIQKYVCGEIDGVDRTPEWAEPICGVAADEIVRFALAYGQTKPAALVPGYSIQRTQGGEDVFRMSVTLQIATGNFGIKGGASGAWNSALSKVRVDTISIAEPQEKYQVPILRWPDAILEGKQGGYPTDIKAIYNVASNYINQGGDIRKGIAAFESVEFSVCHDIFLTPTARYCDVVLPATTFLERNDLVIPWVGNYLLYSQQAIAPVGNARNDYDIFCDLAERLGFLEKFSEGKNETQWLKEFLSSSDIKDIDEFLETGIYISDDNERIGLSEFIDDPENKPLSTPSGKIEIVSEWYAKETGGNLMPMELAFQVDDEYPLRLITPKSPYRIHSQGSNISSLRKRANHAVEMHPDDAFARSINDGDIVTVYNKNGKIRIPVRISSNLMKGVVSIPEGVWFDLDGNGVDVGGSSNMLTSTVGTLPSKACVMHGVGVQIIKQLDS